MAELAEHLDGLFESKFTVGAIVNNHSGVLYRVTGLFQKRGYNIDSLAVGETEDPSISRITFVCTGGEYMRNQVVRQLSKLHDVISVQLFDEKSSVSSEHLLIKISVTDESRPSVSDLINKYSGIVRDFGADFITLELIASSARVDEFIEAARKYHILETCRSGVLAMSRGKNISK